MKKILILLLVAIVATSCAVGTYLPHAENRFGAQTTVVLDKANFRVVRDVEAIVAVNNTKLSRADVAKSAYGELLRKAQLTGSQVLINVVVEEIRRESAGFFRALFGMPKRVQHMAARATVIEFLTDNGEPISSVSYVGNVASVVKNQTRIETVTEPVVKAIEKPMTKEEMAALKKKVEEGFASNGWTKRLVYKSYQYLLGSASEASQECLLTVMNKILTNEISVAAIEKQLAKASDPTEKLNIFMGYCK